MLRTPICAALLVLSSCSENDRATNASAEPERLAIRAGAILADAASPRQLRASFQIVPSQSGAQPILSTGVGGACLIADLNAINIPTSGPNCTTSTDCTGGMPSGGFGYCVAQRCWTRPGLPKPWCDRSADHANAPFDKGQHWLPPATGSGPPQTIDVSPVYALPGAAGKQFQWRVYACLAGVDSNCGTGPGERIVDVGPVRTVD